ncbi:methyl-accepting chemotaxis protein [Aquimixticola soesokkakensis]|nr:methyl-accepting chemotaxis protein [Aquimixticola soesokkakensis]
MAADDLAAIKDAFATVITTPDGTITAVNDLFSKSCGYSCADLLGRNFSDLVRDKDKQEFARIWQALDLGKPNARIMPLLDRKTEEFWVDQKIIPVSRDGTNIDHIYICAHDITHYHLSRRDNRGKVDAVARSMAVIEFDQDGIILAANDIFCRTVGYSVDELVGKHHRILMLEGEANTAEYSAFWSRLAKGSSEKGQIKRRNKKGDIIWLEATYETILDPEVRPFKVVKYAFDITDSKNAAADAEGQITAIGKSQAVIEFKPDGTIVRANDLFCQAMGYDLSEIANKHHSMFVRDTEVSSADYKEFWHRLRAGERFADEFTRIGKGGREVTIRASYNPIYDAAGNVVKVVKFAVDTTIYRQATDALSRSLSALAEGDLTARVTVDLGEFDQLRVNFNAAITKLSQTMSRVVDSTLTIRGESAAIGQATTDLARRTEIQASTLAQSAAALETLLSSVKSVAGTAETVKSQSEDAQNYSDDATAVVEKAVHAMDEIETSAKQVASITSVIDDIAFQTNLLALNAGVEAARAGEAGRGFAVVASEVRALAQRSSEAAREIATLISTSGKQVSTGVNLVREAGGALTQIKQVVESIHSGIVQVAQSTKEQASGLGELNTAVTDLDQTTQHNAAMSEETNAASVSLLGNIKSMEAEVGFFSLMPMTDEDAQSFHPAKPSAGRNVA